MYWSHAKALWNYLYHGAVLGRLFKTTYHQILQNLKAANQVYRLIRLLWNLAGASTAIAADVSANLQTDEIAITIDIACFMKYGDYASLLFVDRGINHDKTPNDRHGIQRPVAPFTNMD